MKLIAIFFRIFYALVITIKYKNNNLSFLNITKVIVLVNLQIYSQNCEVYVCRWVKF